MHEKVSQENIEMKKKKNSPESFPVSGHRLVFYRQPKKNYKTSCTARTENMDKWNITSPIKWFKKLITFNHSVLKKRVVNRVGSPSWHVLTLSLPKYTRSTSVDEPFWSNRSMKPPFLYCTVYKLRRTKLSEDVKGWKTTSHGGYLFIYVIYFFSWKSVFLYFPHAVSRHY